MAPLHLSTYLTLSTYLAIAYAGTSAWIASIYLFIGEFAIYQVFAQQNTT
jgi:hypothetical protein